jgi:hypothetical protein
MEEQARPLPIWRGCTRRHRWSYEMTKTELMDHYTERVNAALDAGREDLVEDLTEAYQAERSRLAAA